VLRNINDVTLRVQPRRDDFRDQSTGASNLPFEMFRLIYPVGHQLVCIRSAVAVEAGYLIFSFGATFGMGAIAICCRISSNYTFDNDLIRRP